MRVATAGKELFGQRDGRDVGTGGFAGGIQRAGAGWQNPRTSKGLLHANAGRPGEDELVPRLALASKGVIGGILRQDASEVGLGAEVGGRNKTIQREVASLR